MNKQKIVDLLEKDFITLDNLEASLHYAIKQHNNKQYQMKILHAAFKRCCDIMLKRRKYISKQLKTPLKILKSPEKALKVPRKSKRPFLNTANKG